MPKAKLPDKDFKWTPKLAYAIGLLVTDGNLSGDGRHITFRSCDLEQIKNFQKCLGLKVKIGAPAPLGPDRKTCFRLQFGGVQFYRWLLKIGLFPAKTYDIGPIQIPEQYFRDFVRGHLDGDGTITVYQDYYNTYKNPAYIYTRLFIRFISASKVHMLWLQDMIQKLLGIKGDLATVKPADSSRVSMYQLKFMKKESIKLLSWLYYSPDIPCLNRKRLKAIQAADKIKLIKRKPYVRKMTMC